MTDRKLKWIAMLVVLASFLFAFDCRGSWAAEDPPSGLNQWTLRNGENTNYTLYDVAFGNGTFVAVGVENYLGTQRDLILYSATGEKWTPVTDHFNKKIYAVTYAADYHVFYAVGDEGLVLTSPDGMNWVKHEFSDVSNMGSSLFNVAYGNNLVVAASDFNVFYSQNQADWMFANRKWLQDSSSIHALAYGNHQFLAMANGYIYASADGLSDWVKTGTFGDTGVYKDIYNLSYNGAQWIAVGVNNYKGIIYASSDATTWNRLNYETKAFRGVDWGSNYFVAVTEDEKIMSSSDGLAWTLRHEPDIFSPPQKLCGVAYGNNTFVAVGYSGIILQSGMITDQSAATLSIASYSPVTFTQTGTIGEGNVQYTGAAEVIAALPQNITVTLEDDSTIDVPVTWTDTDGYDASAAGSYTFTAEWGSLPEGVDNADNIAAPTTEVTVIYGESVPEILTIAQIDPAMIEGSAGESLTLSAGQSSSTAAGGIVKYEWDLNDDGVYEKDQGADTSIIFAIGSSDFPYTIPGSYTVGLKVTDAAGKSAAAQAEINIIDTTAPVWQDGTITAQDISTSSLVLHWTAAEDDVEVTGYKVLRDGTELVTLAGDITSYTVTGLAPDTTYSFKVEARDELGNWSGDGPLIEGVKTRALGMSLICIPGYYTLNNGTKIHETWNDRDITLKAVVLNSSGSLNYQWYDGDGTALSTVGTTSNGVIEGHVVLSDKAAGSIHVFALKVWDSSRELWGSYNVIVQSRTVEVEKRTVIHDALWELYKRQDKSNGSWYNQSPSESRISPTAAAINAFQSQGFCPSLQEVVSGNNHPYIESVRNGYNYIFQNLSVKDVSVWGENTLSPFGSADTNGNGIGIDVPVSPRYPYDMGLVMMALANSRSENYIASIGGAGVLSRNIKDILTDMVDLASYLQLDNGTECGAWSEYLLSNTSPGNLLSSPWMALGLMAAEKEMGVTAPSFVKEKLASWVNANQSQDGRFNYPYPDTVPAQQGAGIVLLDYADGDDAASRVSLAADYLNTIWNATGNLKVIGNYYSMYLIQHGLQSANPAVQTIGEHDWQQEFVSFLLAERDAYTNYAFLWANNLQYPPYSSGQIINSAFAVEMLGMEPMHEDVLAPTWPDGSLATENITENSVTLSWNAATDDTGVAYYIISKDGIIAATVTGDTFTCNITGLEPYTMYNIKIEAEDYAGNRSTDGPGGQVTTSPGTSPQALVPVISISPEGNAVVGREIQVSGEQSYITESGRSIVLYEWDFDQDGVYEVEGITQTHTYQAAGQYTIGLRIKDNQGIANETSITIQVQEASLPVAAFTVIPEVSGGTEPVEVNASSSYHPDDLSRIVLYEWDWSPEYISANEILFTTDDTGLIVQHAYPYIGTYRIALRVTDDAGAQSIAVKTVTVEAQRAPTANAGGPYEMAWGQSVVLNGTLSTDPDKSMGDQIVQYQWDVDNDGVYDDASGANVTIQWNMIYQLLQQNYSSVIDTQTIFTLPVSLKVTDTTGRYHTHVTPLTVYANTGALTVAANSSMTCIAGAPGSFSVTVVGGLAPYTWSAADLPLGLNVDVATGVVTGIPILAGTYSPVLTVTDAEGAVAQKTIAFTVNAFNPLVIKAGYFPVGYQGGAYNTQFWAEGGQEPYTWSASTLPTGLSLDASTGIISGSPEAGGIYHVTVTVEDNQGTKAQIQQTLTVRSMRITTMELPDARWENDYNASLQACGGQAPYTWSISGLLPQGLSLNSSTGIISGYILEGRANGAYDLIVRATDADGQYDDKQVTLWVDCDVMVPRITTSSIPYGIVSGSYAVTIEARGGVPPYNWSAKNLPAGLSINPGSGAITGVPTTAGFTYITLTVANADDANVSSSHLYPFTVLAPLAINTTNLPEATVNKNYCYELAASGGMVSDSYTWSASGLPEGLRINKATGVIYGIPSASGTFTVSMGAADSAGNHEEAMLTLQVEEQAMDECFIATAAYGSKYQPAVTLLRHFRDDFLLKCGPGRAFVAFYYQNSPPLAKYISDNAGLKTLTRVLLTPFVVIVWLLYHPLLAFILLFFITILSIWLKKIFCTYPRLD